MSEISVSQLDSTLGCLFLGFAFSLVLWGAGCLQTYFYYEKYWKTDRGWLKSYILIIWILDTAHQVLLTQISYVLFVRGIADPSLYSRMTRPMSSMAILTAFINAMVQIIFVRRAWYLSEKNRFLSAVLCLCILAQFIAVTDYFGAISHLTLWAELAGVVNIELMMNCVSGITDFIVAAVLIWLLRKRRSGVKRTDSVISRLVQYTIGSSLAAAILTIGALISSRVAPNSLIYILADLLFPKLYFNCVMTFLNARSNFRATLNNEVTYTTIDFAETPTITAGSPSTSQQAPGQV